MAPHAPWSVPIWRGWKTNPAAHRKNPHIPARATAIARAKRAVCQPVDTTTLSPACETNDLIQTFVIRDGRIDEQGERDAVEA